MVRMLGGSLLALLLVRPMTPETIRYLFLGCLLVECLLVGMVADLWDWDWMPEPEQLPGAVAHPVTGKPQTLRRQTDGTYAWEDAF